MGCRWMSLVMPLLGALALQAQDVVKTGQWGNRADRNMVSPAVNLPSELREEDLLWQVRTGSHQYSLPVIHQDRIYVGVNDFALQDDPLFNSTGGGVSMCLDKETGKVLWRFVIPRFENGSDYHFDCFRCGLCSTPVIDGDRMYIVGNRATIICLDLQGQANGNAGPFTDEVKLMGRGRKQDQPLGAADGDVIWEYDMIKELGIYPHDVAGSTVLMHNGLLYCCTSNGLQRDHKTMLAKEAPTLIVLDKETGRLVARDGEQMGDRVLHGQWSSPALGTVNGQTLIYFGCGGGYMYAFEPVVPKAGEVQTLKKVWRVDCNPPEYRMRDGQPLRYCRWNDYTPEGPSEVIATPVLYKDRVYIAIGQSPFHREGRGMLSCLDAATGKQIWASKEVERTTATVSIKDGLLFVSDYSRNLHCFDADTGKRHWVHDLGGPLWCASPLIADGKVYIGTELKDFWVFEAAAEKKVLSRTRLKSVPLSVVAVDDVLYLPTQNQLFAYRKGGKK